MKKHPSRATTNTVFLYLTTVSAILLLTSCAAFKPFNVQNVKTDEFPAYTLGFENALKKTESPNEKSKLHYKLYQLYSCHNNPKPDYKKAYQNLLTYVELRKPETPSHDVMDKLNMLRLLLKLQETTDKLNDSLKGLEKIDKKMEELKDGQ